MQDIRGQAAHEPENPSEDVAMNRADLEKGRELIGFFRRRELAGVEARTVEGSSRLWRCYATEFEFVAPSTWRGEVWHRRRQLELAPGLVLCAHPGEAFAAKRVVSPGGFSALVVERQVLADFVEEHDLPRRVQLRTSATMTEELAGKLARLLQRLRPGSTPLELESSFVDFVATALGELVDPLPSSFSQRLGSEWRAAERVRECLQSDGSMTTDLSSLAKSSGMSRFQALRAFTRRYGLPPHTYQLRVRLGLAQKSLRAGVQPAHVAAEYGFVDQSHLTKHFKRLIGVTPAQYARLGTTGSRR